MGSSSSLDRECFAASVVLREELLRDGLTALAPSARSSERLPTSGDLTPPLGLSRFEALGDRKA